MTTCKRPATWQAGYGLTELALVLAIVAILAVLSTPTFLGAYRGAQLKSAAQEVVALLNQARQMAILTNDQICVHITPTAMHYRQGGCDGSVWIGPGTDAAGNLAIPAGVVLSATASPVFNYLGAATPAATFTVTLAQSGEALQVTVAASGRVAISS